MVGAPARTPRLERQGEAAVCFGPDTWRFARCLRHQAPAASDVRTLIDLDAGSGAGAVVAARATGARRVRSACSVGQGGPARLAQ